MSGPASVRRNPLLSAFIVVAVVAALVLWIAPRDGVSAATTGNQSAAALSTPRNAAQLALHDQMRKLWEDHVTWTRAAIVAFADGSDGFGAAATRLLQNQDDIGDAVATFYGKAAGDELSRLLREHITIAVELLEAAKAGDDPAFNDAHTRWHANGDAIAAFLAAANPEFWPEDVLAEMMMMHLEQTMAEAAHELGGDYAASVRDYDEIHTHILKMSDLLSSGIIRSFPSRFH